MRPDSSDDAVDMLELVCQVIEVYDPAKPEAMLDLIGYAEIGKILGLTRQGAHHRSTHDRAFPKPISDPPGMGRLWLRSAVERYLAHWNGAR